ncbi:MAG: HPr family phosphocarrier protein [Clostridiales bacterium]|nr:HPr family phosphocarrier protein [Clostridiales bacterium]
MKINLNEVSKAQEFVKLCSKYEEDINVCSGRLIIDAKSILGIFSLDLSKSVDVEILSEDTVIEESFYENIANMGIAIDNR